MSSTFIDDPEFIIDTPPETKQALCRHIGAVHRMVSNVCEIYFQRMRKHVYVTPKSYLSFLTSYKKVYSEKYVDLEANES